MYKDKYSLEELVNTFSDHAVKVVKNGKECLEKFESENPGEDLPDWMKDDFNFPKALEEICRELIKIKNSIKN